MDKSIAIQILDEQMVLWEFQKTDFETLNQARWNCMKLMGIDEFKELVRAIRLRILKCRLDIEREDSLN